jgi:GTP-binding protein
MINRELERYSPDLAQRPQIIIANKVDALDESVVDIPAFEKYVDDNGFEMMYVSAATGEGIREMIRVVSERLRLLPPMKIYEGEYEPKDEYKGGGKETIIRREKNVYYVEGEWLYNLMGQINFSDYESLNFFQRVLQKSGVFEELEANGCKDGDTVSIYDFEFDYIK